MLVFPICRINIRITPKWTLCIYAYLPRKLRKQPHSRRHWRNAVFCSGSYTTLIMTLRWSRNPCIWTVEVVIWGVVNRETSITWVGFKSDILFWSSSYQRWWVFDLALGKCYAYGNKWSPPSRLKSNPEMQSQLDKTLLLLANPSAVAGDALPSLPIRSLFALVKKIYKPAG